MTDHDSKRGLRACVPCFVAGVLLLAYSAAAYGIDAQQAATGPTWDVIGTGLIGVVSLLVGAYARGLDRRIGRAELGLSDLKDRVLMDYHTAADTERIVQTGIQPVIVQLGAMQRDIEDIRRIVRHAYGPKPMQHQDDGA